MSPITAREIARQAAAALAAAGVEAPRLDARVLLGATLGLTPERLAAEPERAIGPAEKERFDSLIARRAAREPVSHLLGRREFWSLSFTVTADTLAPRADSETLIEAVLEALDAGREPRDRPYRVLDLGCGTGCLLLALLSELPRSLGIGVDVSEGAVRVARENARALGLSNRTAFAVADWAAALKAPFDIVLSNPPYIPDSEIAALAPEVARHEPRLALAGGPDGLAHYRALAVELPRLARDGAKACLAALEVGAGQAGAVAGILAGQGGRDIAIRRDLGGIERAVLVRFGEKEWRARI